MEVENILKGLGFQDNEVKVYIANLELGMTQVSNIARFSGIKRTTLYGILEKMEEKKILKKHVKNGVTYYEAINPDDLYSILEKQVLGLKEKLPELRAKNNKFSNKPKIYYFEGAENVAELYRMEVKDDPKDIRIFSSNADRKSGERDKLRKLRNEVYDTAKRKADMKLIMNRKPTKSERLWSKFHPKTIGWDKLDIGITIKIYGNKTNFISMNDSITGVVIENEEIARTMESIFDYIYGSGE